MKKLFIFILAIPFAIMLSACAKEEAPQTPTETPTANVENTTSFATIADAMSKSIPLKCTYTSPDGMTMEMYIKGTTMRADAIQKLPTDPKIHEIFKDKKVYIWTEGMKQGMLMDFSKTKPSTETAPVETGGPEVNSPENVVNDLEQQKQTCSIETVSDSIFEVPTDITFMTLNP